MLWLSPQIGPSADATPVRNLSNARQMGLAAQEYSNDHEGQLPLDLTDCVPHYIQPSAFEELRFDPRKSGERARPKSDWRYFGAFFDAKNSPPLLLASPQFFIVGKTNKRIVVRGDLSASIVREEEYQQLLRKTIEAMRQRASALAVPAPSSKSDAQ